ncbi:Facilitated trehalose transporter Tret1-like 20, partial [Homarus americanus]
TVRGYGLYGIVDRFPDALECPYRQYNRRLPHRCSRQEDGHPTCGPPFIIAYLIIGSSVNVMMIYAGRALGGLCVGLLTLTLPVYLGETIQPEIRGILGLFHHFRQRWYLGVLPESNANWWVLAYAGAAVPLTRHDVFCS